MASLFKNGEELARLTKRDTRESSAYTRLITVTTTYSIRSNGWILKKTRFQPYRLNQYTGKREEAFGGSWKRVRKLKDVTNGASMIIVALEQKGYERA